MKLDNKTDKLKHILNNLPDNFLSKKQFCLWKYEQRTNSFKPSKVPYYLHYNTIIKANIKDSTKWLTGYNALKIATEHPYDFSGIGIILINTDLFGLDLDNCLQNGKLSEWTKSIIDHFKDTYMEISPSGTGLHILGKGKLNFITNISYINRSLEAYDGHSIRYLTITGNKFGDSTKIHIYRKSNKHIMWLEKTFFSSKPNIYKENIEKPMLSIVKNINDTDLNEEFINIQRTIELSKDAKLFHKYQSGHLVNKKSTSEDDWHFCLLILKYMKNANPMLLKQFLFYYRNRPKLKRKDYIKLTTKKVIDEAKQNNIVGINYNKQKKSKGTSNKFLNNNITNRHQILKHCNMFDLFTVREQFYPQKQEILIKKDDNNLIKIFTNQSLSGVDLDNYLGILQMANLNLNNKLYTNNEARGDLLDTIKFSLDFKKLSKIINKADGGQFRSSVLKTIRKMSTIYFEYKKTINKAGNYIEGGSHLLSWYSSKNRFHKIQSIDLSINPFAWYIMKKSQYNYCLINTYERFQLPNIHQRLLYFYICRKVIPGLSYPYIFYIQDICEILWGYTTNQNTNKTRRKNTKKICQELCEQKNKLTDFEIKLIKNQLKIEGISVKRHKINLQ